MTSNEWTYEELLDASKAYVEMLHKEASGEKYVKSKYYRELSAKHGRTEKSFEYRMQNISYVRFLMGRSWLTGLKPAKNVGPKNIAIIEKILLELSLEKQAPHASFEAQVREGMTRKAQLFAHPPKGSKHPVATTSEITLLHRDTKVKAWVMLEANGCCEGCGANAPFCTPDGFPFLELHHVRHLADGGSDTITNSVALCPNCHREAHYGINPEATRVALYNPVARLIRE